MNVYYYRNFLAYRRFNRLRRNFAYAAEEEKMMMTIGENIKYFREKKGVSQVQMARDLFMTPQMLCGIETGIKQPSLVIALAIAKYFDITVEQLVEGEPEQA